jgi:hypothetical protein
LPTPVGIATERGTGSIRLAGVDSQESGENEERGGGKGRKDFKYNYYSARSFLLRRIIKIIVM